MSNDFRDQKYRCSCGAEDSVKLTLSERTPPAINCWKCKAGMKVPMEQMIMHKVGMFPIIEK